MLEYSLEDIMLVSAPTMCVYVFLQIEKTSECFLMEKSTLYGVIVLVFSYIA